MIMTNKIVAVALITALVGASLGAAVMHSRDTAQTAETTATTVPDNTPTWNNGRNNGRDVRYTAAMDQRIPSQFNTTEEQGAYKVGFADGFQACGESRNVRVAQSGLIGNSRVAYRNSPYRSSA